MAFARHSIAFARHPMAFARHSMAFARHPMAFARHSRESGNPVSLENHGFPLSRE
jgi:hypothetical protein